MQSVPRQSDTTLSNRSPAVGRFSPTLGFPCIVAASCLASALLHRHLFNKHIGTIAGDSGVTSMNGT